MFHTWYLYETYMICRERLCRTEFKSYKWILSSTKDDNKGRLVRSINLEIKPSDLGNAHMTCFLIVPGEDYGNHRISLPSDLEIISVATHFNEYFEYIKKHDPEHEKYTSVMAWFDKV